MSPSSTWENAWNAAQPRLNALRQSLHFSSPENVPISRVGQLDAEILDQELISLLQEPLNKALVLANTSLKGRFEQELTLFIHLALYKLSIWNTGASYGAKLQDLRYTVAPSASRDRSLAPSGLPKRILIIHGALTVLVPYVHSRFRAHALSRAWPDAPTSDLRRKTWDLLTSFESSYTLLSLASFVAFLWDGRFRTIADRLVNMRLVPSRALLRRDVSYEFMNRQMVWHAFTEFLLFLLPLINARKIRRRVNRITASIASIPSKLQSVFGKRSDPSSTAPRISQALGKYHSLPEDQCAICAENASFNLNMADSANAFTALAVSQSNSEVASQTEPPAYPLYTPYITSCGHVYCYHCVAERMMRTADDAEDEGWECLRCTEVVHSAERFAVEVDEVSGSDYDFSSDFDIDTTDLSGSIGSYSESGLSDDY
ncbi:peroxisomal biogenesis factor 2 [Desarmillaria tabescens]|uniref:RING-type E3 ubiquitin transferase (cysteine targeting) n=1 Tax=Armillaria tabescens TaxID=1929756 RepID=A0AA39TW49_ARMTA|nr:peroxisomal biogenesis factor 2 [Desarmillaria tabescens]KAK0468178.1 peroxisomal biogenesis factor 2 [Desarmillaria tabescens]